MSELPGSSRLILVASEKYPRYAEGDVIALADGRLFLALGRKEGWSDMSPGTIIGSYSIDGGLSWDDEPHVVLERFGEKTDLYSTSLLRTPGGIHLFFMARGKEPKLDTKVYQVVSTDKTKTWGAPVRVSPRAGYHVLNNARVIRTSKGRIIVPTAYVDRGIDKEFNKQRVYCTYSDDDGVTWKESNDLVVEGKPLMEPHVAECADGSLYMIIRTAMGTVWEARSSDGGATWGELRSTGLPAPAAPATLVRAPGSKELWLFFCDRAKADWKGRTRIVFAKSADHGKTWSQVRPIEDDLKHGYGYLSFLVVNGQALLTYYDWPNEGQPGFKNTSLRQRMIPLGWFKDEPVVPVFEKRAGPVLKREMEFEGMSLSVNSGVLVDGDVWRMYYTSGFLGPKGETLGIRYAESKDRGVTWTRDPENIILPARGDDAASYYHGSVHRVGGLIVMHAWKREGKISGLWRFVSEDGKKFMAEPNHRLFVWGTPGTKPPAEVGEGHVSNDAFDMVRNEDGSWVYYAAVLEKAPDARAVFKQDNIPGMVRMMGRATSPDGVRFSPVDVVLQPDYESRGEFAQQFYGMQVFRYRGFWLGLLHTFYVNSQIIQPEWAWSHDGVSWVRTRTPAIALGDEGAFDSRMIVFGSVVVGKDEIVWLYSGMNWRHNAFKKSEIASAVGRATMKLSELDRWLDSLPQP